MGKLVASFNESTLMNCHLPIGFTIEHRDQYTGETVRMELEVSQVYVKNGATN